MEDENMGNSALQNSSSTHKEIQGFPSIRLIAKMLES